MFFNLPEDYKKTVKELRQHLTDDDVSHILASPNYISANQRIIMSLMQKVSHYQELFTLFAMLESIKGTPALSAAIKQLKES